MPAHVQNRPNVSILLSVLLTPLILAALTLFTPGTAAAQGCQQFGCDEVPPVVTPSFDPTVVPLDTMRIIWCDNEWLMPATRTITLNGSNVVGSFSYNSASGCASQALSIGSTTLTPGTTYTLIATIQDEHGNIGTGSVTYTAPNGWVAVNPKGLGVSRPQQSTNLTQAFVVKNPNSAANNYRLVRTCLGQVSSCSAVADTIHLNGGDSTTVSVTYSTGLISSGPTGTIRLRARMTTDTTVADSTDVTISLISSLIVDDSPNNNDAQNMGMCAYNCFANIYAHSTVPYFSLDQPRGVTLVYNHLRMWARPYLMINVSKVAGSPSFTKLKLTIRDSVTGGLIRVQGDAFSDPGAIYFWPGTGTVRLPTLINDGSWLTSHGTGIHPVQITVTATRTGLADEADTVVVPVLVVRETPGAVARGWYVEGIQRLIPTSGSRVIMAEADGSAFVFTATDTLGSYQSPSGELSRLSRAGTDTNTIYTRAYSDSSKVRFNYQGQMLDASDSWGKKVRYAFNAAGRPTRIYDPYRTRPDSTAVPSAYTELVYFADSVLIRPPQADGSSYDASRVTKLRLTSDSLLGAVLDPDGDSTRFAYKDNILPFPLHTRKTFLESVWDRSGTVRATFLYDLFPGGMYKVGSMTLLNATGPVIPWHVSNGNTNSSPPITYLEDWRGRGVPLATSSSSPGQPVTLDTLYSDVRDAASHQSFGRHDRWGQLLQFITHNKKDTTTYFRTGLFADSVRNPIGTVDRFTYTIVAGGRTALASSTPAGQSATNYHYDALGQVDSITGPSTPTIALSRSGGNPALVDQVFVAGYGTTLVYDSWGRMKSSIDHLSHTTEVFFDTTFGNTRKVLREGTRFDSVRFDGYGRDSILTSTVTTKRILTYDVLNRVKRDSVAGSSQATEYTYDKQYLVRVVDPKGQIFKREVNALGWTRKVYDPADTTKFVRHEYTIEGLPAYFKNRRGQAKDMTYYTNDNRHLLTAMSNVDSNFNVNSYAFGYRMNGNVRTGTWTTGSNPYATDTILYDLYGRLDTVITRIGANRTYGIGEALGQRRYIRAYTWSNDGMLLSVKLETRQLTGGTLIRAFTPRNYWWNDTTRELDSISLTGVAASARIKRDFEGKDSTWTFPSAGLTATVLATKRHEPWAQSYSDAAINSALRRGYAYADTIAGRLREMNWGVDSLFLRPFRYSPQGDLSWLSDISIGQQCQTYPGSSVTDVDGYTCFPTSPTVARTLGLEYDAARNLRKQVDSVSSATDTAIVALGNRLTSWGTKSYTFDADGNMITRTIAGATTTFSYDGDGMLRRTIVGSDTTCYEYNAFDQLMFRGTGCRSNLYAGTTPRKALRIYVWDRDQIIAEVDSMASTRFAEYVYRPGTDRPHALLTDSGGTTMARFYHQDMLGNVIGLTHNTSLAQTLTYDPWGELTATTGTLADTSRLRWKGLYWEGGNTNLYYVRNRWYDPQVRRFTSEDPIGIEGGMNQYTFADNDWVNRVDPDGLQSRCIPVWLKGTIVTSMGVPKETPGRWGCANEGDDTGPGASNNPIPEDLFYDPTGLGGGVSEANLGVFLTRYSRPIAATIALAWRVRQFLQRNPIPQGWQWKMAENKLGILFQRPGAFGNADMIRIGLPNAQNPSGYVRFYNAFGQPLTTMGRTGLQAETHIPITYRGPIANWPR